MDGTRNDRGGLSKFDTQINRRSSQFAERSYDQLLPGIPDDITCHNIVPLLSWRDFCVLPRVSRAWQQAIRSGQARLNETFVVLIHHVSPGVKGLTLYSLRRKCCYRLPSNPFCREGIPHLCQVIGMDGKLYVIEGGRQIERGAGEIETTNGNVYMFDISAQRQWKRCATMQKRRHLFACGVVNGKIYVFGGHQIGWKHSNWTHFKSAEVYDPTTNTWSSIPPMRFKRSFHRVASIGEELVVYGGLCEGEMEYGLYVNVYNPFRTKWTQMDPFVEGLHEDRFFVARGKFHSIRQNSIFVHDFQRKSCTHQQPLALPTRYRTFGPIVGVDDELLVTYIGQATSTRHRHFRLLQSKGFGSKKNEIVWEEANCNFLDLSVPWGSFSVFET